MFAWPETLIDARLVLVRKQPYLALAVFSLTPIASPGLGTVAVDRYWRFYYDPEVVAGWSLAEQTGALAHELWHLLRRHAERGAMRDPRKFNIAADIEINDDLREEHKLPAGALFPERFGLKAGLLAEEYYDAIQDKACVPHSATPLSPRDRDAWKSDSSARARVQDEEDDSDGSNTTGVCPICAARGNAICGSGAGGPSLPGELPAHPTAPGDAPLDEEDAALVRHQVAEAIRNAKERGTVPLGAIRWADEVLGAAKIDWRRELAALIRRARAHVAGAVDYSYARPSRRQAATPIILPGLVRPQPEIAIVVDTSGSMSEDQLHAALAEIEGICRQQAGRHVPVLSVDAEVQGIQRVVSARSVRFRGGGGTDMGVGLEHALRLRPRPDVVVVLTDGYTPWPEHPKLRGTRVIIALVDNHELYDQDIESYPVPAWARVVEVPL
jgi:predicted metal-dependent peptidase